MPKQDAVIFDRDGTLYSVEHHMEDRPNGTRGPNWAKFNADCEWDSPVPAVAALFKMIRGGGLRNIATIITSGREDKTRDGMLRAMDRDGLRPDHLFMRETGDNRKDSIVKLEIYAQHIEPNFNVLFVVDDRQQVVDAWRSIGLHVIQVTDPGYPPFPK